MEWSSYKWGSVQCGTLVAPSPRVAVATPSRLLHPNSPHTTYTAAIFTGAGPLGPMLASLSAKLFPGFMAQSLARSAANVNGAFVLTESLRHLNAVLFDFVKVQFSCIASLNLDASVKNSGCSVSAFSVRVKEDSDVEFDCAGYGDFQAPQLFFKENGTSKWEIVQVTACQEEKVNSSSLKSRDPCCSTDTRSGNSPPVVISPSIAHEVIVPNFKFLGAEDKVEEIEVCSQSMRSVGSFLFAIGCQSPEAAVLFEEMIQSGTVRDCFSSDLVAINLIFPQSKQDDL